MSAGREPEGVVREVDAQQAHEDGRGGRRDEQHQGHIAPMTKYAWKNSQYAKARRSNTRPSPCS